MPDTPPTPPGWHQDPQGSGRMRYWDGSSWTSHYGPPPAPHPTPAAATSDTGRSGFWRFWSTLPGVLTGLAALVGAVAGMVVLFRGGDGTTDPPTPPETTVAPATVPPPQQQQPQAVGELDLPALDPVAAANQDLINACGGGDLMACLQIQQILADECFQGFLGSCDVLFAFSAVGSEYERYGATCGNRILDQSFAGQCQFL